jgi:predicted Zn-dependent peptidase
MASILPNGIRYYTKDTDTHYSEVSLLIPVGENHEDTTNIECAHTSEHFACAFNGGFTKPYGFLQLRSKYGVQYHIHTYADHTVFRVTSIPKEAILDICKFLSGIFVLNKPTREIANREIAIVHS